MAHVHYEYPHYTEKEICILKESEFAPLLKIYVSVTKYEIYVFNLTIYGQYNAQSLATG